MTGTRGLHLADTGARFTIFWRPKKPAAPVIVSGWWVTSFRVDRLRPTRWLELAVDERTAAPTAVAKAHYRAGGATGVNAASDLAASLAEVVAQPESYHCRRSAFGAARSRAQPQLMNGAIGIGCRERVRSAELIGGEP